jgi:hypothetical protein
MRIFELINEEESREEIIKRLNARQEQQFLDKVLSAMHRLVQSKGSRQSIGGYAFDIARSFKGLNPRDLEKMYKERYGTQETNDADVESISENSEEITQSMLDKLEQYLDQLFGKLGMDVEFTRHFLDRANDVRNKRPITLKELAILFKDAYIKYGKQIAKMGPDAEAVIKDMRSDVNVPFVLNWDSRNQELDLVAKTVMRKKDFRTPDPELPLN